MITQSTLVDATIIHAPSSTKNDEKARDPDMHPAKKGNQWYFGMKAYFGVDRRAKVIHAMVATAVNVLLPLAYQDPQSGTPACKSVPVTVTLHRESTARTGDARQDKACQSSAVGCMPGR